MKVTWLSAGDAAPLEEEVRAESEASRSARQLFCLLFFKLSLAPSLQQGRR